MRSPQVSLAALLFTFAALLSDLGWHAQAQSVTVTYCEPIAGYRCAEPIPGVINALNATACPSRFNFLLVPPANATAGQTPCCQAVRATGSAVVVRASAALGSVGPLSDGTFLRDVVVPGIERRDATLLDATEDATCRGTISLPGGTTRAPIILPGPGSGAGTDTTPTTVVLLPDGNGGGADSGLPVLPGVTARPSVILPGADMPTTPPATKAATTSTATTAATEPTAPGAPVLPGSPGANILPGPTSPRLPGPASNARSVPEQAQGPPVLPGE